MNSFANNCCVCGKPNKFSGIHYRSPTRDIDAVINLSEPILAQTKHGDPHREEGRSYHRLLVGAGSELFDEKGWDVVATMRKPASEVGVELSKNESILVLALDLTQESSISSAMEKTVETYGKLDVLVNNAGLVELASSEQVVK